MILVNVVCVVCAGCLFAFAGCSDAATETSEHTSIGAEPTTGTTTRQPNLRAAGRDESLNVSKSDLSKECQTRLKEMGWTSEAASSVVELQAPFFEATAESSPEPLEAILAMLGRLGGSSAEHRSIQRELVRTPEIAGLLAGAADVADDGPALIAATFREHPRRDERIVLTNLYLLNAAPDDAVELARALKRDGDVILRLEQAGVLGAVGWFTHLPAEAEAQTEYRKWLRQVFERALRSPDPAELDRATAMLTMHADVVRRRVSADAAFRRDLVDQIWPRFSRVLNSQEDDDGWATYVQDRRVWEFLQQYPERGERLFQTYGPLAVDLLTGEEYTDLHEAVLAALENGNEQVVAALYNDDLRSEPLYRKLFKRNLPGGTLAAVLQKLTTDVKNAPARLKYYDGLTNTILIEEVSAAPDGPQTWLPGYSIYYLGKKYAQGRDVDGEDFVWAAVDAAEGFFIVAKGASKGLKIVRKGAAKHLAKRTAVEAGEAAAKAGTRELAPHILLRALQGVRTTFVAIKKTGTVDVTAAVRFAFTRSRMGRKTFKRITNLDARIFMRADRRVVIDLSEAGKTVVAEILRKSAQNALIHGIDTAIDAATDQTDSAPSETSAANSGRTADEPQRDWRRHAAIWWTANAVDLFVESLPDPRRPRSRQR